jgi:hypothetical protein
MEKAITPRGQRIKRALKHALEDPKIKTVHALAKFIDWYLTVSDKSSKH